MRTAAAIAQLNDARGVFTDLQAENDTAVPLVLAMLHAARTDPRARRWLLRNAAAAAHARDRDGDPGRFFDGPPPSGLVTAWQAGGGLALAIAAGAIAPRDRVEDGDGWARARPLPLRATALPATIAFAGSGIALFGTLGERCCEAGRAALLIDGREPADVTGIWQNKSSLARPIPDTLLFAWRWPARGRHTVRLFADVPNAKEGGAFLHLSRAEVLP